MKTSLYTAAVENKSSGRGFTKRYLSLICSSFLSHRIQAPSPVQISLATVPIEELLILQLVISLIGFHSRYAHGWLHVLCSFLFSSRGPTQKANINYIFVSFIILFIVLREVYLKFVQAQQDISSLKNIAGETGKKLGSIASSLMSDLQDRIL